MCPGFLDMVAQLLQEYTATADLERAYLHRSASRGFSRHFR